MKKLFYLFLSITLFMGSCSKEQSPLEDENLGTDDDTDDPIELSFNVKLGENKTFKVGERVGFSLEGDPESIEFFSGQTGNQYENRDGKPLPSGMSLDFRLHTPQPEPSAFFLMVSTDFDGDFSSFESVTQQNWVDVTDRVTLPSVPSVYAQAGPIDLSDLTVLGKPFYFAIKHVTILHSTTGAGVSWTIRNPEWRSILEDQTEEVIGRLGPELTSENTMGFKVVHENTEYKTTVSQNEASNDVDRFYIAGNKNAPGAETWVVSKGFFDVQEIMGDADLSIPIKSAGNSPLTGYSHVYTAPGTYIAHFVAVVVDESGERKEEVKSVEVVIEE